MKPGARLIYKDHVLYSYIFVRISIKFDVNPSGNLNKLGKHDYFIVHKVKTICDAKPNFQSRVRNFLRSTS